MLTKRTSILNSSGGNPLGSKSPPGPAREIFTKLLILTHQLGALKSLVSQETKSKLT